MSSVVAIATPSVILRLLPGDDFSINFKVSIKLLELLSDTKYQEYKLSHFYIIFCI